MSSYRLPFFLVAGIYALFLLGSHVRYQSALGLARVLFSGFRMRPVILLMDHSSKHIRVFSCAFVYGTLVERILLSRFLIDSDGLVGVVSLSV